MVGYGPIEHAAAVKEVARRVEYFYETKTHFRLYHGHTNSTRSVPRSADNIVDTSSLNHILRFDHAAKTVQVEPNVSMDELLEATLQHRMMPLVVPEFRGITVGGAFAGTAGESSSYRSGLFDSTVQSIEVVLADGTIMQASGSENSDLLRGSGGACGTLGVVTLLEIQLMDAQDYMQLEYYPVRSCTEATALITKLDADPAVSFIDGILFSPSSGVIISGALVSSPPSGTRVYGFTRARDQHYYRHVEKRLKSASNRETWIEAVPIRDYIFRYDRGCFWGAQRSFAYFHVPFNRVTRWMLDGFMASKVMFHALHESGLADRGVIQDVAVPLDKLAEFVRWQAAELSCWPLWLCPLRSVGKDVSQDLDHSRSFGSGRNASLQDLFCNVGIWMLAPSAKADGVVQLNRELEAEVAKLGGLKTLYAHSYYTEEEFWALYDKEGYEALRRKYNAESMMDVFQKVTARATRKENASYVRRVLKERWPFRGVYGVWKVLTSREYLLKDKAQ